MPEISWLHIRVDDETRTITIEAEGGDQPVYIADQCGNKVELGPAGIAIVSSKDIVLKAGGKIRLEATGAVEAASLSDVQVESSSDVTVKGSQVNIEAEASATLSSTGRTNVLGTIVNIN